MNTIRNSTLKRKKGLIKKTKLKNNTPLKKADLRRIYAEKIKSGEKVPYQYHPKNKNKRQFFSIFTDDLSTCVITGSKESIHIHHIFGGAKKSLSEKYGFLIPMRYDWHNMTPYSIHQDRELDLHYKTKCQDYYIQHYGSKEGFISEFGRWWILEDQISA